MAKKNKTEREKQLLKTAAQEAVIAQALQFSRKRFKKFEDIIVQLYLGADLSFSFSDRRIWKINECFNNFSSKVKAADRKILKDVLILLDAKSELVSGEAYIQVLYNMVQFRAYWKQDVFKWKPITKQPAAQVKELAAYLFCKYKIPDFLYQGLYETKNMQYIQWLMHLGDGGRVKEMKNIPIPFTQKMGHYFLLAPAKFSIAEALRWAQVKGLNGEDRLAERITYSWMGTKTYDNEGFWESFIRLVMNGGMFNLNKLTELIDYVREEKRVNSNYTLKGRTLQSLFRQSDVWHSHFSNSRTNQVWKPCGIEGYRAEKKSEVVVLEELTESRKLTEEGKTMKHCVGSYAFYCAKGKSAIFSLRKYSGGILLDIMATIEVNLALQRVVQAKAKMNKPVSEEAKKYMEAWAMSEGLVLNPYL
ncbi:PcfJ domain-containing protein [Ferruginibacter sp.]